MGKVVRRQQHVFLKKLAAGTALLTLTVLTLGGMMTGLSPFGIIKRAILATIVIWIVSWLLIKVMSVYEEVDGGQA